MKRRIEMKKLMAIILTLAMVMSLCVVPASAAGSGVAITITPDKSSVDTATGDAVVTYTVKAKVTDPNLKVGAMTIILDPGTGLKLAEETKKKNPDFYYQANAAKYQYNEETNDTGIFETVFNYAPKTKTFVASGTTNDRNLNSTHGEIVLMTIMGKIAKGTTGSVTLEASTANYGDPSGEASSIVNCDVPPATVTITKAPISSVTASVEKPVAGQALDFAGTVDSGAPYYISKVEWFEGTDATGTPVTDTAATAKAKQFYYARITLTANPGETFAESLDDTYSGDYSVTRNSDTELYLTKAYPETGKLPAASVTAAPTAMPDLKYTGSAQVLLGFVGTASGGDMQYSLDNSTWSTNLPEGTDAKTYTVYYMVKGDSTHSDSAVASISAKIDPKDISTATIGTITDQSYTGGAITPDPEVKDGTKTLVKDTDYIVSCTDTYVGNATLTITGKGNYTGTNSKNFTIVAADQEPTFDTPKNLAKGGQLDLRELVDGAKGDVTFNIPPATPSANLSGYMLTATGITGEVKVSVSITAKDVNNDGKNEYNAFSKSEAITVNVVDKTTDSDTMTVTQDGMTYGDTLPDYVLSGKPAGAGTDTVLYTGTLRNGSAYSDAAKPTEAGTYKVKVKCETATTIYEATSADFTIEPKSISGMTVTLDETTTVYNGITQTVTVTGVGTLTDTDYDVTSGTSGEDVGDYTVTVTGKGNYKDTATATWKITQATPYYTAPTGLTAKYGQTLAAITLPARWSWMDSTQSVGDASTTAKTFKAKFTPADTTNYETVENIEVSVTVGKADAPTLPDITLNQKCNVTTEQSKDIGTAGMPADAGALTYAKGTEGKTGSVAIDSWNVDPTTGKVTYKLSNGAVGDTVTLPVTIKSTNYADSTVNVVITLIKGSSGGYYYAPTAAVVPDMPMLYRGCTGDAVKTLQDKLNALGYNSGSVDGIFGAKTYAAVTAFQKANSLGVDGIVGKLTWGKLYGVSPAMPVETTTVVGRPMVSYGSRGDAVRKLQELLNALGYDCGSVDGIFGSKTKAAVLAFQKANGLGVDGIVGPLTWAKLG